jgi:hypothetical protein
MVTCKKSNAYLPFDKSYVDSGSKPIGSKKSDTTLGMDAAIAIPGVGGGRESTMDGRDDSFLRQV